MKPQYEPKTTDEFLGYVVEECGEVLHASGKTQRWGLDSVNPELPRDQQESNMEWIRREVEDLRGALDRLTKHLDDVYG